MKIAISLLVLLVVSSGYYVNESFAEISENQAFLLEGSGFAVTEKSIKISEIDLGLSSQLQRGSTIDFLTEAGFVTLDDEEFIISELEGKFLREGRYIRINGNIESSNGFDTSISFFGRLIEQSKDAAVYSFSGRITTSNDTYKIIYTTKLSSLTEINQISSSEKLEDLTVHILRGASSQGGQGDYIEQSSIQDQSSSSQSIANPLRLGYFSLDRISVQPGTTITIINDDAVSHRIVSGTGGGTHSNLLTGKICSDIEVNLPEGFYFIPVGHEGSDCDFIFDGRVNTGELQPGDSVSITFEDQGFYRLIDPDYPWMKIDGYVFSNINDIILGQGENLGN